MKRLFLGIIAAGALAVPAAADFPSGTVRIVVPYSPGGSTDLIARLVAEKLPGLLDGAPVIVENKPGATGAIGAEFVARAVPDGHTFLLGTSTLTVDPSIRKLPFTVTRDLAPITDVGSMSFAILANPDLPAKSFADFVAYVKRHPGKVNYGTSGAGSTNHLTGELLKMRLGLDYQHVPYKGSGPAAMAVMANEIQFTIDPAAPHMGHIEAGKLRPLAVTAGRRDQSLPEIPTVAESGLNAFDVSVFLGFFAPAGTPRPVIDRLHRSLAAILNGPEVAQRLRSMGIEPGGAAPDEFAARVTRDVETWGSVIRTSGITLD